MKFTPPIALVVSSIVAVAALPVVSWFSVATRAAATVPEAILDPLNAVIFAPPPTKFAAVTIPEYVALPFVAIVAAERQIDQTISDEKPSLNGTGNNMIRRISKELHERESWSHLSDSN